MIADKLNQNIYKKWVSVYIHQISFHDSFQLYCSTLLALVWVKINPGITNWVGQIFWVRFVSNFALDAAKNHNVKTHKIIKQPIPLRPSYKFLTVLKTFRYVSSCMASPTQCVILDHLKLTNSFFPLLSSNIYILLYICFYIDTDRNAWKSDLSFFQFLSWGINHMMVWKQWKKASAYICIQIWTFIFVFVFLLHPSPDGVKEDLCMSMKTSRS